MRILVTISRTWPNHLRKPTQILTELFERHPRAVLVHGNAQKGDKDLAWIWEGLGGTCEPHPADWVNCAPDCKPGHRKQGRNGREYCPVAGKRRNQEMVETAPELVLSFIWRKSHGATDCTERADLAGLCVVRYTELDEVAT